MKHMQTQVKVRKGDKVKMLAGKDRGKTGKVLTVDKSRERLTVEGLNQLIKHAKPRKQGEKGQRIQYPASVSVSNVSVICPKCEKPARIGWQLLEGNKKKARACKKCNETID